jgi:serine protease Do
MNLFDKFRQQKLMSFTLMIFTLSVGILIGTLVNTQVHAAKGQNVAPDATPLTVPKAVESSNEFTKLAKRLEPSVVNITVEVMPKEVATKPEADAPAPRKRQRPNQGDEGDDPLNQLRQFFGNGEQEATPQTHEVSGTGFIVDKNGYIVTNNHVVEDGAKIVVKLLGDSKEYRGKVIGTDQETDLAVLKIDAGGTPLQPVTIGNSDGVQVGDWAIAVGSPFNLDETVTLGIVSATGRGLDPSKAFQKFIQTDAAINPGNSGGPLVNIRGEVIGVNTMIATSHGGSEGVGFAMPSNMVVRVYNDIIREGRVIRGSIGIKFFTESKPELLRGLGLDHGVLVDLVTKDGPAEKGGLKAEDIITAINGQPIKDGDDLMGRVADTPVGNALTLTVDRDGKKMDLKVVTLDRMELFKGEPDIVGKAYTPGETGKTDSSNTVKFGFYPRALTDDERNSVADKRGVSVTRVEDDSFASDIGLAANDIITAINRQPVNSLDDVKRVAQKLKPGDAVTFRVIRTSRGGVNARGVARRSSAEPEIKYLAGTLPSN